MANNGEVRLGDWVKVTASCGHHACALAIGEVWEGRIEGIRLHRWSRRASDRIVCFTDEHTGEVMEWYEYQVEIVPSSSRLGPPGHDEWLDGLIESLKHSP
tara:strand:+ start:236 stop:538 length:303 start_codon:yes stop_codon:yes gene_type:complete